MDEINDVTDAAQLLILIRGVDQNFTVREELVGLWSLKDTCTGEDLLLMVKVT